jgi:hypothetical protein
MRDAGWRAVELAAQLLDRCESEAVLGDLEEAGGSPWRNLLDISGLIVRQQALLWKSWRPWLASFGLALPASLMLMGFSLSVSLAYRHAGEIAMPLLAGRRVLLAAWSWTGGYAVAAMSKRTLWMSIVSCCLPCLFCLARFRVPSLPSACLLLFLPAAIWGVWQGSRLSGIKTRTAILLATAVTLLTLLFMGEGLPATTWMLIWPAWYLAATAESNTL